MGRDQEVRRILGDRALLDRSIELRQWNLDAGSDDRDVAFVFRTDERGSLILGDLCFAEQMTLPASRDYSNHYPQGGPR